MTWSGKLLAFLLSFSFLFGIALSYAIGSNKKRRVYTPKIVCSSTDTGHAERSRQLPKLKAPQRYAEPDTTFPLPFAEATGFSRGSTTLPGRGKPSTAPPAAGRPAPLTPERTEGPRAPAGPTPPLGTALAAAPRGCSGSSRRAQGSWGGGRGAPRTACRPPRRVAGDPAGPRLSPPRSLRLAPRTWQRRGAAAGRQRARPPAPCRAPARSVPSRAPLLAGCPTRRARCLTAARAAPHPRPAAQPPSAAVTRRRGLAPGGEALRLIGPAARERAPRTAIIGLVRSPCPRGAPRSRGRSGAAAAAEGGPGPSPPLSAARHGGSVRAGRPPPRGGIAASAAEGAGGGAGESPWLWGGLQRLAGAQPAGRQGSGAPRETPAYPRTTSPQQRAARADV